MAIFLRGNVWYMEYRTRKVRRVITTGFHKDEREKAKAAFAAFKLAMGSRPKRSATEGILAAIYGEEESSAGIPLAAMWQIYDDWRKAKGRVTSGDNFINQRNLFARFVKWASDQGCEDISDVSVGVAQNFVRSLVNANKTKRTYCGYISQVWTAVGQLHPGVHNPWPAATPDDDGSSVRKEVFTEDEIARILKEAKRAGHDWYLACMVALYTGLRYGNIATMQIEDIDFDKWIFTGVHLKTKHSSKAEILIPVAEPLKPLLLERRGRIGFLLPEHGVKYTSGKNPQPLEVPFSAVLKAVGIEGEEYGFHSFRHTANSRMAEAGVPSEIRQILCGWSNGAMARHYDHATHLKELTEAVAKI